MPEKRRLIAFRITEAKRVVREIMEAGETPILVGHAGIGKTQLIQQIGEQTGRKVECLLLSQMEPGDLLELPYKDEETKQTMFLPPKWFPKDGKTILFLDEINRAHISVRNAIMQIILYRRINEHILPEGVWLCAARNPPTDEYEVYEMFDAAFFDRFVWLKLTNSPDGFIEFMEEKYKADRELPGFIKASNKLQASSPQLRNQFSDFNLPKLQPTNRSFERAYKIYKHLSRETKEKHLPEIFEGIIGAQGVLFAEFLIKEEKTFTKEDLLKGDVERALKTSSETRVSVAKMVIYDENLKLKAKELENVAKVLTEAYSDEEFMVLIRDANNEQALKRLHTLFEKENNLKERIFAILSQTPDPFGIMEKI